MCAPATLRRLSFVDERRPAAYISFLLMSAASVEKNIFCFGNERRQPVHSAPPPFNPAVKLVFTSPTILGYSGIAPNPLLPPKILDTEHVIFTGGTEKHAYHGYRQIPHKYRLKYFKRILNSIFLRLYRKVFNFYTSPTIS